jgi:2-haloalkanoic acid dehalogenase type II
MDKVRSTTRTGHDADAPRFAVDAVCFDLLTALLDSWSLWEAVTADAGWPGRGRRWRESALRLVTGAGRYRPYEGLVASAAEEVGLPRDLATRLLTRWTELRPWPEVPTVLARLRLPLATATNCPERLARLASAAVPVAFAVVVSAERAGAYKPAAAPYRLAVTELGLPPQRTLFVAGSAHDVGGALGVGMPVVWVNRLGVPAPLEAASATIVSDLGDLPEMIG